MFSVHKLILEVFANMIPIICTLLIPLGPSWFFVLFHEFKIVVQVVMVCKWNEAHNIGANLCGVSSISVFCFDQLIETLLDNMFLKWSWNVYASPRALEATNLANLSFFY